jgi:hypothetical protein
MVEPSSNKSWTCCTPFGALLPFDLGDGLVILPLTAVVLFVPETVVGGLIGVIGVVVAVGLGGVAGREGFFDLPHPYPKVATTMNTATIRIHCFIAYPSSFLDAPVYRLGFLRPTAPL